MFKFIKNLFKKEKKIDLNTAENLFKDDKIAKKGSCAGCKLAPMCLNRGDYDYRCDFTVDMSNFDKAKDSILLVEDNEGVINFLEEDIDYLIEQKKIKDKYNILSFTGTLAAFNFEVSQRKLNGLNIKYAILDITLGGSIMTESGNLKYTGVDVLEMIFKYNPEVSFLFYTGNNLNPYINANARLIKQFKDMTGEDIEDYILFKTSLDIDTRRESLVKRLFKK